MVYIVGPYFEEALLALELVAFAMTEGSLDCFVASGLGEIAILLGVHAAAAEFGADEGEEDDVGEDATHEDADDEAVFVTEDFALGWEGKSFANAGFDCGGGGRDQIAELVGGPDYKSAETTGCELH